MGVIAALLPPGPVQRLRSAIKDRDELLVCEDWAALTHVCERQPVRVAVIDLFHQGVANFDRIRQLKQRLPRLALVCYVAASAERAHDLFNAGRQGMNALVVLDRDDAPIEFLRILASAESGAVADVVRKLLSGVDSVVYDAVMLSITKAHERLSPASLARLLSHPRRTVSQRLLSAGYPPPLRLLTWGRLIVAAHMMEDARRSADRVAATLDFPSGSAYRNTCQRYLHATPGQIRTRGGAQYVIRGFFRQVQVAPMLATQFPRASRPRALAV